MIYSYTLVNTFHDVCPRQAYERWWLKIKVPESPEMVAGMKDHKSLEKRLKHGHQLPDHLDGVEPICEAFMARGIPQAEVKFAVDRDLADTGFFDDDCYIRGVSDVKLYNAANTSVFIGDWKTGKPKEDGEPLQLMINAAAEFAATPTANAVSCANIYTKTATMGTVHNWQRSEVPTLWRSIVPLIDEIEDAEEKLQQGKNVDLAFPKRQGPLCGWCPVFTCSFNRNTQRGQ